MSVGEPETCPECGSRALARVRDAPSWCVACEWNLGRWPQPKYRYRRRAILRNRRRSFAMNRRMLAALSGSYPTNPRRSRAATLLTAASVLLLLVMGALIGFGVYLLFVGFWLLKVLGAAMVLVGIECRPRFGRVDYASGEIDRAECPNLWAVVDEAQRAVGAPRIDILTTSNELNATCGQVGLRRKTVLEIGLPLWGALSVAGRQALLGHELGHLVNRDPTTGFLTQPALTTFGRLARIFDPDDLIASANSFLDSVGSLVAYIVFFPVFFTCRGVHHALLRAASHDHQRAEIYADAISSRLGGSAGAAELVRVLLADRAAAIGLTRGAKESQDPEVWRAHVARTVMLSEIEERVAEQKSMRYEASQYRAHPPAGVRSRLVRSWPPTEPMVAPPDEAYAASDRELAKRYRSAQRAILNSEIC